MKTLINWKIFFILWLAAILATTAVLPYAFELQAELIAQVPIPLPALIALQIVQSGFLFAIAIFFGLLLMKRIGLSTPILDSATKGESASETLRSIVPISIGLGVIASFLILGLDFLFQPLILNELGDNATALALTSTAQPAAWKGLLASFYGGIGEEILLRLFVMSLLAWLGSFISKTSEGKPTIIIFWIANILAAILFGLGHLPAVSTLVPLTTLVVIRTVTLNAVGGIIFGWLYQTRGLESAMVAHFSADIVLHVLFAL